MGKARLTRWLGIVILFALAGYVGGFALNGPRSVYAYRQLQADTAALQGRHDALLTESAQLAERVAVLRGDGNRPVDRDMLEEQVRRVFGHLHPHEVYLAD